MLKSKISIFGGGGGCSPTNFWYWVHKCWNPKFPLFVGGGGCHLWNVWNLMLPPSVHLGWTKKIWHKISPLILSMCITDSLLGELIIQVKQDTMYYHCISTFPPYLYFEGTDSFTSIKRLVTEFAESWCSQSMTGSRKLKIYLEFTRLFEIIFTTKPDFWLNIVKVRKFYIVTCWMQWRIQVREHDTPLCFIFWYRRIFFFANKCLSLPHSAHFFHISL